MTTAARQPEWGSDVPPSSPVAPIRPRLVSFGGFCFTDGGIALDLSDVEAAEFSRPPIAPYTDPDDRDERIR